MAYSAIPDTSKLRLNTGKIVEDVLFKFAKDMDYEHHAHSYIVNFDDENIKALFTDEEWKELTEDRKIWSKNVRKTTYNRYDDVS